ncbi:MAG: cold-shock protein [Chloroflexota bacterium]
MANNLKAVLGSVAACGVLLLAGCSSGTTASAPSATASAAASEMSSAAPAPSAPMSSAPAEVPAAIVLAKWECTKDGEEVTCICEGSEADCKSTVAEPSKVKGAGGTVRFFNRDKGFGFITRDDGGANVFVHITAVERAGLSGLVAGQRITFEFEMDRTGKVSATNLNLY